jgi:hypothetical protein
VDRGERDENVVAQLAQVGFEPVQAWLETQSRWGARADTRNRLTPGKLEELLDRLEKESGKLGGVEITLVRLVVAVSRCAMFPARSPHCFRINCKLVSVLVP